MVRFLKNYTLYTFFPCIILFGISFSSHAGLGSRLQQAWDNASNFVQQNTRMFNSWDDFRDTHIDAYGRFSGYLAETIAWVTDCREDRYRGIHLMCFTRGGMQKVKEAIDFLYMDPNAYPEIGQPLQFVKGKYTKIGWAHSDRFKIMLPWLTGNMHGYNATTTGGKEAFVVLSRSFMELSVAERAATLIHEALHGSLGPHSCGSKQDQTASSVYGAHIRYLAEVAHRTNHPMLSHCQDRLATLNAAIYLNSIKFCSTSTVDLSAYNIGNCGTVHDLLKIPNTYNDFTNPDSYRNQSCYTENKNVEETIKNIKNNKTVEKLP